MSLTSTVPFQAFWSQSWSAPLRAACHWLQRDPAPIVPCLPEALAPGWLRPLCVQREVARAIRDRLAWMRAHPDQSAFLYRDDTIPCWTREDWTPYDRGWLHLWTDEWLLVRFSMDVERLLRIVIAPPKLLGEEVWTRSALGSCERIAQLYKEFQRRYGTRATRKFVRQNLCIYVSWYPIEEPEEQTGVARQEEDNAAHELIPVGSAPAC